MSKHAAVSPMPTLVVVPLPRPKHRGHSHPYRAVYDNLGQSRAECLNGITYPCDRAFCPRHDAGNYTVLASHAPESL